MQSTSAATHNKTGSSLSSCHHPHFVHYTHRDILLFQQTKDALFSEIYMVNIKYLTSLSDCKTYSTDLFSYLQCKYKSFPSLKHFIHI